MEEPLIPYLETDESTSVSQLQIQRSMMRINSNSRVWKQRSRLYHPFLQGLNYDLNDVSVLVEVR